MITTEEIKKRLWDGANELRGSMDASRYKVLYSNLTLMQQTALNKIYDAYLELKEFEIASINCGEVNVDYEFESPYTDLPDEKLQEMDKHNMKLNETIKNLKFTNENSDKFFTVVTDEGLLAVSVTYK